MMVYRTKAYMPLSISYASLERISFSFIFISSRPMRKAFIGHMLAVVLSVCALHQFTTPHSIKQFATNCTSVMPTNDVEEDLKTAILSACLPPPLSYGYRYGQSGSGAAQQGGTQQGAGQKGGGRGRKASFTIRLNATGYKFTQVIVIPRGCTVTLRGAPEGDP